MSALALRFDLDSSFGYATFRRRPDARSSSHSININFKRSHLVSLQTILRLLFSLLSPRFVLSIVALASLVTRARLFAVARFT
jgi:hypothetical protein